MKSLSQKIIAFLLTICLLLGAFSAMAETVYVLESATVYAIPGDASSAICTVPAGTTLNRDATMNGWSRVQNGGYTAFMKSSDLTVAQSCQVVAYAAKETKLYKTFTTDSKKLATIPVGATVLVAATAGDWGYANYNGVIGFVRLSALTTQAPQAADPAIQPMNVAAYANKENTRVYNTSGKVVCTIPLNTQVTIKAVRDELCLVERDGMTAIMYGCDLSDRKIETNPVVTIAPTTYYICNDGAAVYGASGNVICTLELNFALTVSAYNNTHALVSCNGNQGFVLRSDLSTAKTQVEQIIQYGDKGETVSQIQARLLELGYFTGSVGGNYLELTQGAVAAFQKAANLTADGKVNAATWTALFSENAPKVERKEPTGDSTAVAATGTAQEMDWWKSDIQTIFARGTTAVITDVETRIAWNEIRKGGTNHADVQPVTAADTAAMKKAVGSWSWNRRAIFVTIDGKNYAASMNAMPHGSDSVSGNNFDGHHCIHFTNSRTHGSNKVCSLHQAAIKKAAAATL